MQVVLVEPGKAARITEIGEDLQDMQEIVGGLIQALYPWEDPAAIVCNDEGKIMGAAVKPCSGRLRYYYRNLFYLWHSGRKLLQSDGTAAAKISAEVSMPGKIYSHTKWAFVPQNRVGSDSEREKQKAV